jgi:hypothetical protein
VSDVDSPDPAWEELWAKIQHFADHTVAERRERTKKAVMRTCLAVLLASSVFFAGFGIGHGAVKRAAAPRCHVLLIDRSGAPPRWEPAPDALCRFARPEDDLVIVIVGAAPDDDQSDSPGAPSASGGFASSI